MKTRTTILLCALLLITGTTMAGERIVVGGLTGVNPHEAAESYPVLLALSGGGARGLASIGVIKAFEEKQINVRAIAGTSMGGIVGGLYAAGYSADQLTAIVSGMDFADLFSNEPARTTMFVTRRAERDRHLVTIRFNGLTPEIPRGLTAGQKLTSLFTSLTNKSTYLAEGQFSHFPIPFLTVGTDIVTGDLVLFESGSLADAMRATMAYPLAFTAVERGERLLMDGGMKVPIPVDQVRTLCDSVSFVVAVNTASPLLAKDDITTPIDVASQVTTIMTADKLARQLASADYVMTPLGPEFSASDFDEKQAIIDSGYAAGLVAADSIITLLRGRKSAGVVHIRDMSIVAPPGYDVNLIHAEFFDHTFTHDQLLDEIKQLTRRDSIFSIVAEIDTIGEYETDHVPAVSLGLDISASPSRDEVTIIFQGNTIFDDTTLQNAMHLPRTMVDADDFRIGIGEILSLYEAEGYDFADIRRVAYDQETATIAIDIDEAIIRRIDVDNNFRSRDWLIRSYFPLSVGEPYSTRKASQGIANIYGTDLFDRVTVDLVPYDGGAIVKIRVVEKPPTQIRLGWHWDDQYRSEEFVELLDDNVLGIGLEMLAHARFGEDRWDYHLGAKLDRLFHTYLTARTRLYYHRLDRPLFDLESNEIGVRKEEQWGFLFGVGQQIARLGTVTGYMNFKEARWNDRVDGTSRKIGLRSLILESFVENFNRLPFPTSGNRFLFELQLTGKVFGGETEFTRVYATLETYQTIARLVTYHPHVSIGISRTGLPPTEKFYMGGLHSFSGYHTDELSGDKIFLLNQELRLKLPLRLYLSLHWDIGDVYSSADQIKISNLRYGYGATAAVDSPIGPVEFGYGATDRDAGDLDQFYFRAGLKF